MTQTNTMEVEVMTTDAKVKRISYYYRGMIERGANANYRWTEGWSAQSDDNLPLYPWMTKRECQQEANRQDARAVFVYDEKQRIA
jgi:hypothetical protein